MELLPAIDLRGGRCVRLYQGDYGRETVYGDDPVAQATAFAAAGAPWIHVVDLDAARTGEPVNRPVIAAIAAAVDVPVQVGGGVRDIAAASALFDAGVARVVVGTAALEDPAFVRTLAAERRVAVGLDVNGREVAVRGWVEGSGRALHEVAAEFADAGVEALVVTQIARDGTLEGPDLELYRELLGSTPIEVVASGGVGTSADLLALAALVEGGRTLAGVIVGRALYEGRFTLDEALAASAGRAGVMRVARVIPCLDVTGGRVVKGVNFVGLRDAGDPVELAARYDREGADELVFLDITASSDDRDTMLDVVTRTAEQVFIPFTVGGGIRSVDDARRMLRAGVDKVSLNTAAVLRPEVISEISVEFGAQCVVVAIDARRTLDPSGPASGFEVFTHGGRTATGIDAVEWAARAEELGAGEILLTSMDRDGTRDGFDVELTHAISSRVGVPVIASGGVGTLDHLADGVVDGGADAVLAASIFHFGEHTVGEAKARMTERGILVRPADLDTDLYSGSGGA